jgi:iron complex outermembrane receptor protein/outer membrane receptor for ferrienterochelin and colicins
MKKELAAIVFILLGIINTKAQNTFSAIIKDAGTAEVLPGASVNFKGVAVVSDNEGKVVVKNILNGKTRIDISSVGYKPQSLDLTFPLPVPDSVFIILLEKDVKEEEEVVVVASSRTESGIENLPTKVEILGVEEVNEEVGIKPGNIASLLGDVAGIQIQQTSAATGNAEMRVQGLPGKYTQILKDGMPLFGGYSGSFSILQIPPLDLKQIEIVKGASSTLYGGGAIAGMVNLISKRPKEGVFEKTVLLNQSTFKESNVNMYLSNRKNKTGFTFFSGITYQRPVDVNKDGFSDLPDLTSFFFHPTVFFYPDKKNMIYIGYNGVFENRKGGDMQVIKGKKEIDHQYFVGNRSYRNTFDASWENKINNTDRFTLKGTVSWFDRQIETNVFGMKATQLSWFTEASYLKKGKNNDFVAGINFTGEQFRKKLPDSTQISNFTNSNIGLFVQNDLKFSSTLIMQTGLRTDFYSRYGSFILPRISFLYKISRSFTSRIGGGLGYKIPTVFSSDIDERDYLNLLPLQNVKAERSIGANWDINYHQKINGWDLTANQTLFYNKINHPIINSIDNFNNISFYNASAPITTKGFETYIQVLHDALEIYLGYIYTSAKRLYDKDHPNLDLIAKNKFATIVAYEFSHRFRAGVESAYTDKQYLDDGSRTQGYLFAAAMMRYDLNNISFVLNCENLLDYRQTKKEEIVIPPYNNPTFRQLWAPIDGRVVNFSIRIKL